MFYVCVLLLWLSFFLSFFYSVSPLSCLRVNVVVSRSRLGVRAVLMFLLVGFCVDPCLSFGAGG